MYFLTNTSFRKHALPDKRVVHITLVSTACEDRYYGIMSSREAGP